MRTMTKIGITLGTTIGIAITCVTMYVAGIFTVLKIVYDQYPGRIGNSKYKHYQ